MLNVLPSWRGLHALPNRDAAPPPVLIIFVVSAADFEDAMIWFAGAGTSSGLAPFDRLDDDADEYDPAGTLLPFFRATLETLFVCPFEPACIFERMCTDPPPAGLGLA